MMRHGKGLIALAALAGALMLLYVLGADVRESWTSFERGQITIPASDDFALNAPYEGDLTIFAQTIELGPEAVVSGSASLVGSTVILQGEIQGNLSATASQIRLEPDSQVGGRAVLTGDTVQVEGAIHGELIVSAGSAEIGPTATLDGAAQVCANTVSDGRSADSLLSDCTPVGAAPESSALTLALTLAAVLAGGVLAAAPVAVAPLRLGQMSARLRQRPGARLVLGIVALGLWGVLAVLLALIPGTLGEVVLILFLGASALLALPALWLGGSLVSLWIGVPLVRLVRRAPTPEPLAALVGGLIVGGLLAVIGPWSVLGLAALAVIGLAGFSVRYPTHADSPRSTTYFVQG